MTAYRYEQLTLTDGKQVTLRLTEDRDTWLQGWEVELTDRQSGATFDATWTEINRLHWIEKIAIRERVPAETPHRSAE